MSIFPNKTQRLRTRWLENLKLKMNLNLFYRVQLTCLISQNKANKVDSCYQIFAILNPTKILFVFLKQSERTCERFFGSNDFCLFLFLLSQLIKEKFHICKYHSAMSHVKQQQYSERVSAVLFSTKMPSWCQYACVAVINNHWWVLCVGMFHCLTQKRSKPPTFVLSDLTGRPRGNFDQSALEWEQWRGFRPETGCGTSAGVVCSVHLLPVTVKLVLDLVLSLPSSELCAFTLLVFTPSVFCVDIC